ncbi:MAG: recombinase RecA [Planctomycetes bacterium]|nr:recombinase RecA [Planctomycetota bacterium]
MAARESRPPGRTTPLDDAIERIRRVHGEGAILTLGAPAAGSPVAGISTGSPSLDRILGGAGVPRGRNTVIFGPEASGKSALAHSCLARAQKKGGVAVLVDSEHALHPPLARAIGVDLDRLLISQPDSGEQALDIAEALIRSGGVDALAVDSVAALVPRAELEGEMGDDSDPGRQARLLSQALRRLAGSVHQSRTAVVFVNQLRARLGTFFGNPETTPGGRALKYYASVRIELRPVGVLKSLGQTIGIRVEAKVVKNKIAPPFQATEFEILYGRGISREADLLDLALAAKVVAKSGEWFSLGETRLGRGRESAIDMLAENADLREKIEKALGIS